MNPHGNPVEIHRTKENLHGIIETHQINNRESILWNPGSNDSLIWPNVIHRRRLAIMSRGGVSCWMQESQSLTRPVTGTCRNTAQTMHREEHMRCS